MKSTTLPFRVRIGISLTLILIGLWWGSKTDHSIIAGKASPLVSSWEYFMVGAVISLSGGLLLGANLVLRFRALRKQRQELFLTSRVQQTDTALIRLAQFKGRHRLFCRIDNWLQNRARRAAARRRDWEMGDQW